MLEYYLCFLSQFFNLFTTSLLIIVNIKRFVDEMNNAIVVITRIRIIYKLIRIII